MNQPQANPCSRSTALLLMLAAATAAQPLLAQTAPATPAPEPANEDEIIELSPFEVTAADSNGYAATQTLAGTRIRTDLRDVASSISVVTKEFLTDIGATDSSTLLQYTANAEVAGTRGIYTGLGNGTSVDETATLRNPSLNNRVRGLAAVDNTRDYFVSDIPWDSYNVERVDIQRGPNSILYGLGSPAGIVNAALNTATFRNRGSVEYRFGSYGSQRANLDVNHVLVKDVLAIRLSGLWDDEKFKQDPAFEEDKRYYGSLRFDPKLFREQGFRTSIRLKYENGEIDANRPRNVPPLDSITPWFRPVNTDPNSMDGGLGKLAIENGYVVGSAPSTLNPWLGGVVNQQQPLWFINGDNAELQRIYGGYVNTGARNAAGVPQGAGTSLIGQRYADVFTSIGNFATYANNARLTNSQYGQYRNRSLTDSTVFDFFNHLIDGPNKKEWENWDAYNIDFSQTAFNDRLGLQLSYDRQEYDRGGQGLLGNPALSIDILQNFQDYVVGPNNASNPNVANPNFGRPYVVGGPGRGNSYRSDREYVRASLFAELRASDVLDRESLLAQIIGKHRLNGVYSKETYETENRSWQMTANSAAYAAYKLQGNPDGLINLPPTAVIYLGPSIAGASTASGAAIPGIGTNVTLEDGNIYQFASTWRNPAGVNFTDPWTVPANLQGLFNGAPVINPTTGQPYAQLTQVSNPANYIGWNSDFRNELVRSDEGNNPALITAASKSLRQTRSYAGSWQGFLWKDAFIATAGWRYDEVQSKNVSASPLAGAANRGSLNLDPNIYRLPDAFPTNQTFKDHSTAGGLVVHLNRILPTDVLPINVSLSYNKSNNFQVTDLRRDIYGNSIANPKGATKEYGVTLSTKDDKYSLRAIKYETSVSGTSTQLDNSGIYGTIRDALNWRNIKTYYMSAYAWGTAGQTNLTPYTGQRYLWDPVYVDNTTGRPVASGALATGPANSRLETRAEADTRRDASLKAINDMQLWLAERGYFQAWNYGVGPTTPGALQTRGQYEASPLQPDPASVYDYRTAPLMQGFAVTADTVSKGYEFEATANPTPNWRIAFNAAKTEATRMNVGGPVLDELVSYMDTLMAGPGGDLVRFNSDYSAANELRQAWTGWRGQYTLLKLQENTAASELRKWTYRVVTNYSFRNGFLKGSNVGASYRWADKVVIGYPVIPGTGGLASFDLDRPFFGPSEDAIDLWVGYERKLTSKVNWRIQLNARNVGKSNDLIPISVQPDGKTLASVRIAPTQEWFVTNTFSF